MLMHASPVLLCACETNQKHRKNFSESQHIHHSYHLQYLDTAKSFTIDLSFQVHKHQWTYHSNHGVPFNPICPATEWIMHTSPVLLCACETNQKHRNNFSESQHTHHSYHLQYLDTAKSFTIDLSFQVHKHQWT